MAGQPTFAPGVKLDRLVADLHAPRSRNLQKVDAAQKRRLAAARRSHKRRHAAFGEAHADVLQHDVVAEPLLDMLELDHARASMKPP